MIGMSSALDVLSKLNMDSLRRNKFCIGVKRGREYRCGGDANENAINNAVDLLVEAVNRMLRWRVWDSWWIDKHREEWLSARERLEVQLRDKYSEDIVNDLLRLVDKFINYNEKFLNYWREVGSEVKELIEDLMNGRAEVIVRPSGVSVYYKYITLETNKPNAGGVIVQLSLKGFRGMTFRIPDMFRRTMSKEEYRRFIRKVLKALRSGFAETDEGVEKGRPVMKTTQIWQAIVWSLLYPGEIHIHVNAININEDNVAVIWRLRSNNHKSLKGAILNNANKLSKEELLAFMCTATLGDGDASIKNVNGYSEAVIRIVMSNENAWRPLLMRLKGMGFNCGKPEPAGGGAVYVPFHGSSAIDLVKAMISILPSILRDVLDALDFEKWERIKRIAEMEVKFKIGESRIVVAGYGFTVNIQKNTVILAHKAWDEVEVESVIEALRARYGDEFHAYVNKSGKYLVIRIPMRVFKGHDDIKAQVIEVLCRKLKRAKDEEKRRTIIKHLIRLTAPTKGAAAVSGPPP